MCCLSTISSCPVKEAVTRLLLWLLYFLNYLAHVGLFLFFFDKCGRYTYYLSREI